MEKITSRNNDLIKYIKKLSTSRKARFQEKKFVLEGARLSFDVLNSFYQPDVFLITEKAAEKYEKQLQTTTSANDSVRILYYLFDLSDRRGQIKLAWQLYHTAGRAENVTAQLDMLRNLGTFYANNDSVIAQLIEYTEAIPNEVARSATKTFILNQQISRKSRQPDDTMLQRMLLDSIRHSHNLGGNDIYDKISLLYQIIQYLGVDADGVLFKECLDRYAELMEELPNSDLSSIHI